MYQLAVALKWRMRTFSKDDWQPVIEYLEQLQTPEMEGVHRHSESINDKRIRQLKQMLDRMDFWVHCNWRNWPLGESIFRGDAGNLDQIDPSQLCKFLTALLQNQTSGGDALNIAFDNGLVLRIVEILAAEAQNAKG